MTDAAGAPKEILIINSKLKAYIKAKGFSTASTVAEKLSEKVRVLIDQAVESAKNDKRKTVMDRDIP